MAFMSHALRDVIAGKPLNFVPWNPQVEEWILGSFAKVVLQADSEQQLLDIHNAAKEAGLMSHLITDSGFTEFHGVPTHTAVAIGPDYAENIDKITGPEGRFPLKLY